MSKREQIILILTGIVAIVGVYMVFFDKPKKPMAAKQVVQIGDLQEFVNQMTAKVSTDDFTDKDSYIIERATSAWEYDPFSNIDLPNEGKTKDSGDQTYSFTYTGYIQVGNDLMAVINGLEYNVGEELGQPGCILHSISPEKVIVNVGNRKMIALPLEDTM